MSGSNRATFMLVVLVCLAVVTVFFITSNQAIHTTTSAVKSMALQAAPDNKPDESSSVTPTAAPALSQPQNIITTQALPAALPASNLHLRDPMDTIEQTVVPEALSPLKASEKTLEAPLIDDMNVEEALSAEMIAEEEHEAEQMLSQAENVPLAKIPEATPVQVESIIHNEINNQGTEVRHRRNTHFGVGFEFRNGSNHHQATHVTQ